MFWCVRVLVRARQHTITGDVLVLVLARVQAHWRRGRKVGMDSRSLIGDLMKVRQKRMMQQQLTRGDP